MGGSDNKSAKRVRGVGPGVGQDCPVRFSTIVAGPVQGVVKGAWLNVTLDRAGSLPRVTLIDNVTGAIVGSLAGIPNLAILIRCLENGVPYRAIVDHVNGGRIDVTVLRG